MYISVSLNAFANTDGKLMYSSFNAVSSGDRTMEDGDDICCCPTIEANAYIITHICRVN